MWTEHAENPPCVLPNDWRLVSAEWHASETRYRTGTAEAAAEAAEEEEAAEDPADRGGPAVEAAGRGVLLGARGCINSRWPSERGPWPSTTPSRSGKAV